MDVVGGISGAIKLVVKAKELADKLKNLELKGVVVDLQSQLLDLKEEIIALREENIQLKESQKKQEALPEMTVKDGLYFKPDGDGPFCTGCFDTQGRLVRLAEHEKRVQRLVGRWHCPGCRVNYSGS